MRLNQSSIPSLFGWFRRVANSALRQPPICAHSRRRRKIDFHGQLVTNKEFPARNPQRLQLLLEKAIEVTGPGNRAVVMYNGADRQTYSSARPIVRAG